MIKRQFEQFARLSPQATAARFSQDDLDSAQGVDYSYLRDLLKAQNFKAADYETYLRMLEVVGRKEGDWIGNDEFLRFPCTDLNTIDRLWMSYSEGRFGFSMQNQIYVQCGAALNGQYPGDRIWRKFGDRVGWRINGSWINQEHVIFSPIAPPGHLPVCGWWIIWLFFVGMLTGEVVSFPSLALKIDQCAKKL